MERVVLGLTGPIGSGKTTCANFLVQNDWTRLPFAGPLKDMLRAIGLTEEDLNGSTKEIPNTILCGKTPRYAMQTLGTKWRELIGRDLWVNIWKSRAMQHRRVVVDDVRFPHEVTAIRELGGKVIRIERGLTDQDNPSEHVSEQNFDFLDVDRTVYNYGRLDELQYVFDANVQVLFQ